MHSRDQLVRKVRKPPIRIGRRGYCWRADLRQRQIESTTSALARAACAPSCAHPTQAPPSFWPRTEENRKAGRDLPERTMGPMETEGKLRTGRGRFPAPWSSGSASFTNQSVTFTAACGSKAFHPRPVCYLCDAALHAIAGEMAS